MDKEQFDVLKSDVDGLKDRVHSLEHAVQNLDHKIDNVRVELGSKLNNLERVFIFGLSILSILSGYGIYRSYVNGKAQPSAYMVPAVLPANPPVYNFDKK